METLLEISKTCTVVGCKNFVEQYNIDKQKLHPSSFKFRICSKHKNGHNQHGQRFIIACVFCGNDTGAIQRKACKICKKEWLKIQGNKHNERRKKPKGNCLGCGIYLSRILFGQKIKYCTEKCRHMVYYQRWANKNRPRGKCPGCGIQLDPILHKGKKKYCSYSCWGEHYYKNRKGLNKSKVLVKQ